MFSHDSSQKQDGKRGGRGSPCSVSLGEECFLEHFSKLGSASPGLVHMPSVTAGVLGTCVSDLVRFYGGRLCHPEKKGLGMAGGWAAQTVCSLTDLRAALHCRGCCLNFIDRNTEAYYRCLVSLSGLF